MAPATTATKSATTDIITGTDFLHSTATDRSKSGTTEADTDDAKSDAAVVATDDSKSGTTEADTDDAKSSSTEADSADDTAAGAEAASDDAAGAEPSDKSPA